MKRTWGACARQKSGGRIGNTIAAAVLAALGVAAALPVCAEGLPETVEAINKTRVTTRILFITAHPDDEASSLLVYLSRGLDADVALLTITRGQGGQNSIGPEQGAELGILRTHELLGASTHNGVTQFFTRAPDFGFSKSAEQTLKIWGDLPLEDMVRVIRTFRPDIVINGWGGVHTGHGQHQASGILTPQAVAAASDPGRFPEQIHEGLTPWKVSMILDMRRDGTPGAFEVPLNSVSPIWGKSYNELGRESLSFHRSQGVTNFLDSPFFRRPLSLIVEGDSQNPVKLSPEVLAQPLTSLAARYPSLQSAMDPALKQADDHLAAAQKSALVLNRDAAATHLAEAGIVIENLRKQIAGNSDEAVAAVWQLDRVRDRIDHALAEDVGLLLRVRSERAEIVPGESFHVDVSEQGYPAVPVKWNVPLANVILPAGWTAAPDKPDEDEGFGFSIRVPADASAVTSAAEGILSWPTPPVQVAAQVAWDGYEFRVQEPAVAVVATSTNVDVYPVSVVPTVTLTVEPQHIMIPEKTLAVATPKPLELLARVRYHGTSPADVSVGLEAPKGWGVSPVVPLKFAAAGDELVRFQITPPADARAASYPLRPYARLGDRTFRTSLLPLPSLPTRSWSEPADATATVLNLAVPAHLRVGYITGGTDPIPDVLRQIGVQVDLLDEVALAFGDLGRYDSIVVGIRGYELRPDLMRNNPRLLEYVKNGGTLIVQYQRDFAWAKYHPAPFPADMGQSAARVTDANSPVRFLEPESPLLKFPNEITTADFNGWVQERGLYFWGKFGTPYQAVLGLHDPGESEATGGLVWARDGKGSYIYTGLSFFRELPAGVPGAYRLFINLLSQSRAGTLGETLATSK